MSSHGRQKMEGGERRKKKQSRFLKILLSEKRRSSLSVGEVKKKKINQKTFWVIYIYILHHICLLSSQFTGAKRSHLKQWRSGAGDEFPFSPHPPQRLPLPLPWPHQQWWWLAGWAGGGGGGSAAGRGPGLPSPWDWPVEWWLTSAAWSACRPWWCWRSRAWSGPAGPGPGWGRGVFPVPGSARRPAMS